VVEIALDVRIHHPPAAYQAFFHDFDSLACATFGSKPVRAVLEVRLENRFDHDLTGLLHHPVTNRRNAQRSLSAIRLGDIHPQHRLWSVRVRLQVLLNLGKKRSHACSFDVVDTQTVRPGAAAVLAYFFPGPPQNIRPEDAVIERVEPSVPARFGRQEELALELLCFVSGVVDPVWVCTDTYLPAKRG